MAKVPARSGRRRVLPRPRSTPAARRPASSTGTPATEAWRQRALDGEPPPTKDEFERLFDRTWVPVAFPDAESEESYRRRRRTMIDKFWADELARPSEVLEEELDFVLVIDPGDGSPAVRVKGSIDRLDRTASGGVEVIDYKTGNPESQKSVGENLQLSIYALACRDELGLGVPERVTLYFTESAQRLSTTRTDEQLEAARVDLLARAARIRSGDFAATPGEACRYCDYRAMCPERKEG